MKKKIICALLLASFSFGTFGHGELQIPVTQTINSTGIVVVKGKTEYPLQTVTLMLVDKNADVYNINASDIGYMKQAQTDAYGGYIFNFKCDNAESYMLITGVNGEDVTSGVTEAALKCDKYITEIDVLLSKYNMKATVNIENIFGLTDNEHYAPLFAFYNGNNLISVRKSEESNIEQKKTTKLFECEVPVGTTSAKAFVWSTDEMNIPLCDAKNTVADFFEKYIHQRQSAGTGGAQILALENTFKRLNLEHKLNVAFFGGSVTSGVGSTDEGTYSWRAKTMQWFNTNYPDAEIKYCNAAIGGTGSRLGAYRIYHDVLDKMSPDLIFLMHSINDVSIEENSEEGKERVKRQVETEINSIREVNPYADIVIMYDIDRGTAKQLYDEDMSNPDEEHEFYWTSDINEELARFYNISSVNLGKALTSKLGADIDNDSVWSQYFNIEGGGLSVHPTNKGYAEYFKVINEFLEEQRYMTKDKTGDPPSEFVMPNPCTQLLSKPTCLSGDGLLEGLIDCEWNKVIINPNYHDFETNENTRYDISYPIKYEATAANQSLTYKFIGSEFAIRMYGGGIEYSVDEGLYKSVDRIVSSPLVCAENLEYKEHTITFRTTGSYNPDQGKTFFDCIMIR